jgi:hypothetical protein
VLEAYASATALIRDTERAAVQNPASILNAMIAENGARPVAGRLLMPCARAMP